MSKLRRLLIIALVTVVVVVGGYTAWKQLIIMEERKDLQRYETILKVQPLEAIVTNMEINEAAGIESDAELIKKVKKTADDIWKATTEDGYYGLTEIMRMIHIYTYLGLDDYAEEIKERIFKDYYNADMDAFSEIHGASEEINNDNNQIMLDSHTIGSADYIYDYIPSEKYDMIEKAVELYNKYIEKASDNEDALYIVYDSFWFLLEKEEIKRIDYMRMLPYMEEYIQSEQDTIEAGEINMNTVSDVSMCADRQRVFGMGDAYKGVDQKIYEQIDSREAFDFVGIDEVELMLFNSNLKEVDDVSKNSYYVENINTWLLECYEKFIVDFNVK